MRGFNLDLDEDAPDEELSRGQSYKGTKEELSRGDEKGTATSLVDWHGRGAEGGAGRDTGGLGARRGAGRRRQPLIVVASLIDKLPNLGGIARTCEILGARSL